MYRLLPPETRLGFGDIVAAPWLFDVYVRQDAGALVRQQNGGRDYLIKTPEPPERDRSNPKDGVYAASDYGSYAFGHGNHRRAIILTDDCEMASLEGRDGGRTRGRIVVAAIKDATDEQVAAVGPRKFSQLGLPAHGELTPGIVDLGAAFSVHATAFINAEDPKTWVRLTSLDADGQRALAQKWCAHATRHGPLVAETEARKLAKLLSADGDPELAAQLDDPTSGVLPHPDHQAIASAVAAAAIAAWDLEGTALDAVADAWEQRERPEASRAMLVEILHALKDATDRGLALLEPNDHAVLADETGAAGSDITLPRP